MRIKISAMKIVSTENMRDIDRIDTQLKTLILAIEGTIPGSRGFGLTREFISLPPDEAINIIAMELDRKVEEYIPEISIVDVSGTCDLHGSLELTVQIERREDE